MKTICVLDQGTTSTRAIVYDLSGNVLVSVQKDFNQYYPKSGWVEHDPMEIYADAYSAIIEAYTKASIDISSCLGIGITNQRETLVAFSKKDGKPFYNAIVWQCRRTAERIEEIRKDSSLSKYIHKTTGLIPDSYFSASKMEWIIDNVSEAKEALKNGDLLFGTIDTYLTYRLTKGKIFKTDYTNASRTMLFDIEKLCWDPYLCKLFKVPVSCLPEVCPSSSDYGEVELFNQKIKICALVGDQQSSLFGLNCFKKGEVKCTYGTGGFVLINTLDTKPVSSSGLITTLSAQTEKEKPSYALEGSVFIAGALVKWLKENMRFINDPADSEYFALKAKSSNGVYIVPAFTGLGAPYWDMYARGTVFGLTRSTTREEIIRASLESIAYQIQDLLEVLRKDTGLQIDGLKVDGGCSANNFLMQFQADISNIYVLKSPNKESTALGAFYLAGIQAGAFSLNDILNREKEYTSFSPKLGEIERQKLIKRWKKAVKMSLGWSKED